MDTKTREAIRAITARFKAAGIDQETATVQMIGPAGTNGLIRMENWLRDNNTSLKADLLKASRAIIHDQM